MKAKLIIITTALLALASCQNRNVTSITPEKLSSNDKGNGTSLEIKFIKGEEHNHPTFSFWLEDLEGNYIETLFVTKYLGTGIYGHASLGEGKWDSKAGESKRPATLPYWLHKRDIMADGETYLPTPEQPVPDAITGATPTGDFVLNTASSATLPQKFRLLMEINQPWDWNDYWHNDLYPDNWDYKTSCQPSLVYAVTIDLSEQGISYFLNPIGHGHYAGDDGGLYTDLTTITTAKEIVQKVEVKINK